MSKKLVYTVYVAIKNDPSSNAGHAWWCKLPNASSN